MEEMATIITTTIAVFVFVCSILNYAIIQPLKTADKSNQERWEEARSVLNAQIAELKSSVMGYIEEIKINNAEIMEQNIELRDRIVREETVAQQSIKRIERLEERLERLMQK